MRWLERDCKDNKKRTPWVPMWGLLSRLRFAHTNGATLTTKKDQHQQKVQFRQLFSLAYQLKEALL
jgi:hypothetical protein